MRENVGRSGELKLETLGSCGSYGRLCHSQIDSQSPEYLDDTNLACLRTPAPQVQHPASILRRDSRSFISPAAKMTSKIDRIITRLQKRIAEGQPEEQYEAQQETRLVAARYTKASNWPAAIDILASVSQALLKAGQGGSGGDLAILLVDVYKQSSQKPDAASKGRLLTCLRLFDSEEPTRKKFIKEMIE